MSARLAVKERPNESRTRLAPRPAAVQPLARVAPPPAEEKPKHAFAIIGDPLWGMAIASIILFAVLAALIAIG